MQVVEKLEDGHALVESNGLAPLTVHQRRHLASWLNRAKGHLLMFTGEQIHLNLLDMLGTF
jgi:hypothetical protein